MEYSTITFKKNNDMQHWHIVAGKYQAHGFSKDLESAEIDAYKALGMMPSSGTVHCIYKDGKRVKPVNAIN